MNYMSKIALVLAIFLQSSPTKNKMYIQRKSLMTHQVLTAIKQDGTYSNAANRIECPKSVFCCPKTKVVSVVSNYPLCGCQHCLARMEVTNDRTWL
jgi:hypothetical protein